MRPVSLLLLAPGILALPQDLGSLLGGFLGNRGGGRSLQDTVRNIINNPVIQERILNNDLNPCPGELPTSCVCTNGNSFRPSNFLDLNQGNPCGGRGARPDTCTCPTGATFRADVVAESVANRYQIPTCGQGVEPNQCQCRDGSTFTPTLVSSPPCGGRPLNIDSCTCPNGDTITANNFIAAAVPLIQDILG